jgi:adenylate kinase family enzyme
MGDHPMSAQATIPDVASTMSAASLPAELELLLQGFRLRAQRRQAWLQNIWKAAEVQGESALELCDADAPAEEERWIRSDPAARRWTEQVAAVMQSLAGHSKTRLFLIGRIFGFSEEEFDLFQACLPLALDPSLARSCANLQEHPQRTYMTEDLAARLFGYGRCSVWSAESTLFRWDIIRHREVSPAEPSVIVLDPWVRDWILGLNSLDETLIGLASLHPPRHPLASWPVDRVADDLRAKLRADNPERMRVRITGHRGSGRRTFAAVVSSRLGLPLLTIDADAVDDSHWRRVFCRAQRQAYLQRCVPAWIGESLLHRPWPTEVLPFPLQFVITEGRTDLPPARNAVEYKVAMPNLQFEDRSAAWCQFAPQDWSQDQVHSLAARYRVDIGDIAEACSGGPGTPEELGQRVREASRSRLDHLAQLLPCPFAWDDLVLPLPLKEDLQDFLFEAEHRLEFWERKEAQRLFPQGRGLIALLSGPPGTGKTMSAQVIAASLGYDLFRIDLSSVVSKYVGETSQNLEKVLSRAAHMDAVLLFDEADALFSKRTNEVRDAQDRFANTDAAYLLQAIENYPGIAVLATNQKASMDSAFLRRLRFVIEFTKPGAPQRLEIWMRVLRELAGESRVAALSNELSLLSQSVETTGAQIKNSVLGAIFVARRAGTELTMRHLLRALDRELAKEGRSIGTKDRERMRKYVC